jgi:hypothetical protein
MMRGTEHKRHKKHKNRIGNQLFCFLCLLCSVPFRPKGWNRGCFGRTMGRPPIRFCLTVKKYPGKRRM